MALYLIGIGLGGVTDVTVRGLELMKQSDIVYLEAYTAILCDTNASAGPGQLTTKEEHLFDSTIHALSRLTGKSVQLADRNLVEDAEALLEPIRRGETVSLLVVGDPFSATTHSDLYVRCRKEGMHVEVIHNATILTAVGISGLQLYRFGSIATLCFWTQTWKPDSWKIPVLENFRRGLHSLILLDIKVKEVSDENLARGRTNVFEPPRYMTAVDGAAQLLSVLSNEHVVNATGETVTAGDLLVVALARIGCADQVVHSDTLQNLTTMDPAALGPPLHCIVLCGQVHDCEREHLETFKKKK